MIGFLTKLLTEFLTFSGHNSINDQAIDRVFDCFQGTVLYSLGQF